MERLVKILKEKNLTISSCESLTGGMFASEIVGVSGASSVFKGSFVTYMDECKEILLDGKEILKTLGAISEEMAYKMASVVKFKLDTNIAVSFTGNAGPTPMEDKPVGLIYIGIAYKDYISTFAYELSGGRQDIVKQAISIGIEKILEILKSDLKLNCIDE